MPRFHAGGLVNWPFLRNPYEPGNIGAQRLDSLARIVHALKVNAGGGVSRHTLVISSVLFREFDPFVTDLDALNGYVVAGGIHGWPFPFADPAILEIPAEHVVVLFVLENNGAIAAIGDAVEDVLVPLPKILIAAVP